MVRCPLSTLAWLARTRSVTAERPGSSSGFIVNLSSHAEELARTYETDNSIIETVKDDRDPSIRVEEQAPARAKRVEESIVTYAVRGRDVGSAST